MQQHLMQQMECEEMMQCRGYELMQCRGWRTKRCNTGGGAWRNVAKQTVEYEMMQFRGEELSGVIADDVKR